MSYIDDYNDRSVGGKIPYDDIPISRRADTRKSSSRSAFPGFKILVSVVVVLLVVNFALIITTFYYLRHSVVKTVNYNYNEITNSVGSVSAASVQSATWSSVAIASGGRITDEYSFYNATGVSRGSGVILKKASGMVYILTCYHVIDGNENNVYVLPYSGLIPVKVTTVGYSSRYDIAVLKVSDSDVFDGSTAIVAYDSKYLSVGDESFAVGNSLGHGIVATSGIVSRLNLLIQTESNYEIRVLQTSAEINPGNSGGGLFNGEGKFIGLVNAKTHSKTLSSGTITVVGMAYAIPGTFAISIANSIIQNGGNPSHVDTGIEFSYNTNYGITSELVEYNGQTKMIDKYYCVVNSISAGSIASGNLKTGDMVKSFTYTDKNGEVHTEQMYNIYSFEDIMYSVKENTDISFEISRLSTDMTVTFRASSFTIW
jgi:serine protease Do